MTIKEIQELLKGLPRDTEVTVLNEDAREVPIRLGGRQFTITDKETKVKVWLEI